MVDVERIRQGFSAGGAAVLEVSRSAHIRPMVRRMIEGVSVYDSSLTSVHRGLLAAAREGRQRRIVAVVDATDRPDWFDRFAGEERPVDGLVAKVVPYDHPNMAALRSVVSFLNPQPIGLYASFGMGDRIGLATPGHIAAGRRNPELRLMLPQQSIREMERTGRTPDDVMDDATFGEFVCGYNRPFGADADHLKTTDDIDACLKAGFTMITLDPSDHVDGQVDDDPPDAVDSKYEALADEGDLATEALESQYEGKSFTVSRSGTDDLSIEFDRGTFRRAVVKYGRAVAHAVRLARHAASAASSREYEIELSIDETDKPTSPAEHYFIAAELRDAGVRIVSIAPRFVGDFEKGIDYKGDLVQFETSLAEHVAIANEFGPYKISVHSGSDKFSAYPIVARVTEGMFHVKTAGTSYLEAVRAVCRHDKELFREIVEFSRERFNTDKATYHISSDLSRVPPPAELSDEEGERVYLDEDDGRQVLHVTYGSVLTATTDDGLPRFGRRIIEALWDHEQTHFDVLEKHLGRHIDLLTIRP